MMNNSRRQFGFSLVEALLATGILGVGLVLIATVFPVGVKLTGIGVDRTVGAMVADEAIAKIRFYGLSDFALWPAAQIAQANNVAAYRPPGSRWENAAYDTFDNYLYTTAFWNWGSDGVPWTWDDVRIDAQWPEFRYPSVAATHDDLRSIHWSALCRRAGENEAQVTVFVTRRIAEGMHYYGYVYNWPNNQYVAVSNSAWPMPVRVAVLYDASRPRQLQVSTNNNPAWSGGAVLGFFGEGATVAADHNGQLYRVMDYRADDDVKNTLVLNRDWEPSSDIVEYLWVVPPGVGSTRNPVIGVRQTTITNF